MISYIVATILALILGQVSAHLICRLPEIIEDDDAIKKLIPTLKTGFKWDYKYTLVLVALFNLVSFFVGNIYMSYIYMVLISMLVVVFVIDFKMQLIPDTVQIIIALLGVVAIIFEPSTWINRLIGMAIGGGIFLLIALFSKIVFKKEGMGMGDIKLMAGLGFLFGIKDLPVSVIDFFNQAEIIFTITVLAFFMAAIVAIILIATKKTEKTSYMAFGPYIVIATILVILFGTDTFINVYLDLCTGLANVITELMLKLVE